MLEIPMQLQNKKIRLIKINSNTKAPIEADWANGGNYRYTESEFKNYLKTAKSYGVACGFGNLVIVDIENIEDKSVANLVMNHKFPATFTVQTGGGGWHLYYYVSGFNSRVRLTKKGKHYGEIQAKGNQCIGPGSLHPTGNRYTILNDSEIKTIPKDTLLSILSGFTAEKDASKFTLNSISGLDWDIGDLITPIQKILKEKGWPLLETKDDNKWRGSHPLHGSATGQNFEIDIEKNTWYCFRCEVGGDAVNLVAMLEGLVSVNEECPPREKFRKIFKKAKTLGITKYSYKDDGYKPAEKGATKDGIDLFIWIACGKGRKRHLNTNVIATHFKELNPSLVMESITGKGAHIYVYQDGCYKVNGQNILETFIKSLFTVHKEPWTSHYESEIVKYVKTSKAISRDKFKQSSELINFKNGVYDLKKKTLRRHDVEKDYFLYKIPWKYAPNIKLTKPIKDYLTSTFNNDPDVIAMVQELFGYCLYSNYNHSGLFYLYGTGGNGKKVFMTLLEQMLGVENITSKSINSLVTTRFSTASLYGKLLNSCGELSGRVLKETDMLKRLTGGDRIEAEFKNLDGFDFDNIAKIITACNSIPYSYDDSDGWYDRQFIIPFLQKFRYSSEEDNHLSEKLVNKKNMESLLCWAVEGLHRLLKNGEFTYPKNRKNIYLMYQGNTKYFVKNCYSRSSDLNEYVKVDDIRTHYKEWCKENNIPLDSDEALSRAFRFFELPVAQLISEKNKKIYVRHGMKKVK